MYGIKERGKYNVDFEGLIYAGKIPYQMVIFEEFNGDTPVKNSRKTLYFRDNIGLKGDYIIPEFKTETEVEKYLHYRNNTKLQLYNKLVVETVSNNDFMGGFETMLKINMYMDYMEIRQLKNVEADAELLTVEIESGAKTYSFEYESGTEAEAGKLFCYEQIDGETIDKIFTFDLFENLIFCNSNAEIITKILDYIGA